MLENEIATQSLTIRLPVHITEKRNKIKKALIDEYTEIFLISFYKEYVWQNYCIYSIQGEYPDSFRIINS